MSDQPKSDCTSVTISKRVHREFKIACARFGYTQGFMLERIITDWLREIVYPEYPPQKKEE